jgi:hypothetical protein
MEERRVRIRILALGVVIFAVSIACIGQVIKGSISGTVSDQQGSVLPGADVKAIEVSTGAAFTTTANESGVFRLNLLPVGTYHVEISNEGFEMAKTDGLIVAAGAVSDLGLVHMTVGKASVSVEVSAEAPLVSNEAQVTNTFTGLALHTFVGLQENQGLDNLALFVPGVSSTRDSNFSQTNGGGGFSSNGLRGRNNDQEIDGQNNNEKTVGGPSVALSDAEFVQQYVIVTNNFGPEYGRNAGGVVNIITKSGTNSWHGSLYSTENNSGLNSLTTGQKDASMLTKPPRSNDEFGGFTIGGPAIKNKVFVFGGFDEEVIASSSSFSDGQITPTPTGLQALAACFPTGPSAAAVAALTKFGPFGFSAGSPTIENLTSLTNITGCPNVEAGTVSRLFETPNHIYNGIVRVDLQSDKDRLSARYFLNRFTILNQPDDPAAGYVFNITSRAQAILFSETHAFSSNLINEARFGFDRVNVQEGGNSFGSEQTAAHIAQGISNVAFQDPSVQGFGPSPDLPQAFVDNTWQLQDNLVYVRGNHQLKAGINFSLQKSPTTFLPFVDGSYQFADLNSYIQNQPVALGIAVGNPELAFQENDTFLYVGDDWRVRHNLTLNLGLTWSYYSQPDNLLNQLDTKNETSSNPLFSPQVPLAYRVVPKVANYYKAFGPSIGFAYTPDWGGAITGQGKTVIRGGYRLSYDPAYYNIYLNLATTAPHILSTVITNSPSLNLTMPAAPNGPSTLAALGNALPVGQLDPRSLGETLLPADFRPDMVHSWSLGVQREVTKNTAVEIRYVGNHALNLLQAANGNPYVGTTANPGLAQEFPNLVPPGVTGCTNPQVIPNFNETVSPALGRSNCNQGVLETYRNSAYSDYNGLQTQFRASDLFGQLTLQSSYTWSKTTDNATDAFSTGAGGATNQIAQDPFNSTRGEHALSGLDFPQQWSLTFTEVLPFLRERHDFVGLLAGGWSIAGNYLIASGQAYTPTMSSFAAATDLFITPNAFGPNGADFYDQNFLNQFDFGDARPFLGNPHAAENTVGIFAGDACNIGLSSSAACALSAGQLVSLNALNATNPQAVPVSTSQVRFIANTLMAQQSFGTPFGNVARNSLRDAHTNTISLSLSKKWQLGERFSAEFHSTFVNAFNHTNFVSVNPFVENAGNPNIGAAFAVPRLDLGNSGTGDGIPGSPVQASRRIYFGATLRF